MRKITFGFVALAMLGTAGGCALSARTSASYSEANVHIKKAYAFYEQKTCEGQRLALEHYADAVDLLSQRRASKKARSAKAKVLRNSAVIYNSMGRPDSALAQLQRSLALLDRLGDEAYGAFVQNTLAKVHYGLGDLDAATVHYREALGKMQVLETQEESALLATNIGVLHHVLGHPDSALYFLNRARLLAESSRDTLGVSVALNNVARVFHTLGRPDSSVIYLQRALAYRRHLDDPTGAAIVLHNLGYSFSLLEQPDSALHAYRQALERLEETCNPAVQGMTLINTGRALLRTGHPDSALVYLRRGLQANKETGGLNVQSWALNDIGHVYQQVGRPDSALAYFQQALAVLRDLGDRAREGVTLYNLGQTYAARRQEGDVRRAMAYFDSASVVRASVRSRTGADANGLSFAEQDVQLFEDWALTALMHSEAGGKEASEGAALAALAASERGRAQALLSLMQATQPSLQPGVDLAEEGRHLLAEAVQTGAAVLAYLVTFDTLVVWLARPHEPLRVARSALSQDSLATLVRGLRLGLGADEAARSATPLERNVRPTSGPGSDSTALRRLAQAVLPETLRAHLPDSGEVVIIPHGALGLVPFAALPLDEPGDVFGGRYAVRYAPSLAALAELERADEVAGSNGIDAIKREETPPYARALVVGNPVTGTVLDDRGEEIHLAPLPGAEKEAAWVAGALDVRQPLVGAVATEAAVKAAIAEAPLVHLATHGYAYSSDERARDTFIALAPDQENDGLLTMGEVLDELPRLSAELVVLSACQTG
ncbi:MAG: CHAT domain-containing protein, partial [Rhodothermales bacterium]